MQKIREITVLLHKMIGYKTVYGNYKEFDECINYIKKYLERSKLNIVDYVFNKDKAIIISNTSSKKLDVIFCGHLDVVPAKEELFVPKIINDRLYGRGSLDMKGHVCVMIELFKNLNTSKKVALFLTSDEERGGFNGTNRILNNLGYNSKIAIVPDAGKDFELVVEEKGVLQLKVNYIGRESHSAQPWNGDNSIEKLIELYRYLLKIYPLPKSDREYITSINLSKISGGDAINKVPGSSCMILDIRHIRSDSKENIINSIKKFDSKINVEIVATGDSFCLNEKNELVKKYINITEKLLNKKLVKKEYEGSSDGRFFSSKNIPCILMNAMGDNFHSDNEFINLNSLNDLYNIYYKFLNL